MDGTWNLEVDTPFGKYPATLVFGQENGTTTARVESKLGNLPLAEVKTTPQGFDATASYDFCGHIYTASITGQVEGARLSGVIKVDFPFAPPVNFTGERAEHTDAQASGERP